MSDGETATWTKSEKNALMMIFICIVVLVFFLIYACIVSYIAASEAKMQARQARETIDTIRREAHDTVETIRKENDLMVERYKAEGAGHATEVRKRLAHLEYVNRMAKEYDDARKAGKPAKEAGKAAAEVK